MRGLNHAAVKAPKIDVRGRLAWVTGGMALLAVVLLARAVDLQVLDHDFYQDQGDQRFVRERVIPVSRGTITDRNGEPLAISTPVVSIWAQPQELANHADRLPELAAALRLDPTDLAKRVAERSNREFMYLRRHLTPDAASAVEALKIPGVNSQREFRRYYPAGELTAHVLGFTNVDDRGQEGLELAFDQWLSGRSGAKRIIQNRRGEVVEDVELLKEPVPGQTLPLSIDRRIQFLAHRALAQTIETHRADSGTMVVLDIPTGEILAMANWPSYNPNARGSGGADARRNRAVTDLFEPGSVIKAFTVAAGLESGRFDLNTRIDTTPGTFPIARHVVRDIHNYGVVDLTRLLTKSSNVGSVKIVLELENEHFYDVLHRFGFGQPTNSGFPGEVAGVLPPPERWGTIEKVTLSYGYGLSATPLQVAQSYAALANHGRLRPPTFIRGGNDQRADQAVLDPVIADQLLAMLETVTGPEGTAQRARVPNYRVAGKTGTSRKVMPGGYQSRYISFFAGMLPVSNPRLVGVVVINDPRGEFYFGGLVAAPVFGEVMRGAMRLLDVPPDDLLVPTLLAHQAPAPASSPVSDQARIEDFAEVVE
jgi:cell division protein FtsI (penicillin-binding protein 3)